MNNIFFELNFKLNFDPILEKINDFDFSEKRFRMTYCSLPEHLEADIKRIFNLPSKSYMAFHKLDCNNNYSYLTKWHVDTHRLTSIIIVASKENSNHYTEFLNGHIIKVPYRQGVPMVLNVQIPHKVTNCDLTEPRLALSIGLIDTSFDSVKDLIKEKKFINYNGFLYNSFKPMVI
jgi:hypothetical protein